MTKDDRKAILARNLKEFRTAAGFTQRTLSDEIDVAERTISSWENKKSQPDILEAKVLADLYERSLDDFVDPDPPKARRSTSSKSA